MLRMPITIAAINTNYAMPTSQRTPAAKVSVPALPTPDAQTASLTQDS